MLRKVGSYFEPDLTRSRLPLLTEEDARSSTGGSGSAPSLTPREEDILRLLVEGTGTADIAEELVLARSTVRNHVARLLTKLGAHSRLEAVATARRLALL
jgi:DNA-binding NarL/FixJ family response regulator